MNAFMGADALVTREPSLKHCRRSWLQKEFNTFAKRLRVVAAITGAGKCQQVNCNMTNEQIYEWAIGGGVRRLLNGAK